jgi:hypothetical protein
MNTETEYTSPEWEKVKTRVQDQFKREPDVKSILFLIGIRELGVGKKNFKKEEKQDLMNLAFGVIAGISGYFEITGKEKKGWPVFEQKKPLPRMDPKEQEQFIIEHIILYFEKENLI